MRLSITLATYNVRPYIKESLDSIINQTFSDFELICLDDASTDGTAEVLKEYARKDERIRLILKNKNEGLAVARNQCLAEARGEYVTFLDGDDLYDRTLFQKAVDLAEKESSDMVFWDYVTFYNSKEIERLRAEKSALIGVDPLNKKALLKRPSFTWVKLLRTEKAKELGIHFPPRFTRQDIPVHWHLVTGLDKISILPERLAYYRQQPDATTAKKDGKLFHLVYVMDIVEEYLRNNGLYEAYREDFLEQRLNFFAGMYDNIQHDLKREALRLINDRMTEEMRRYLRAGGTLRPHTRYFLASLDGSVTAKLKLKGWLFSRTLYRKIKR